MEVLSYYSVMTLILALTWILIFVANNKLRREIIIISLLAIFLLPVWTVTQAGTGQEMQNLFSSLAILDFLFLFSVSGISATIFHIFFGKHYHNLPKLKKQKNKQVISQFWILRIFITFLTFVWIAIFFSMLLGLSVTYSLLISAIIITVYVTCHRKDLLADSIWSALLTALIVYIASFLGSVFTHTTPVIPFIQTNEFFYGASVNLLCWAFTLGLVLGPLYEYIRHKKLS
ncbi:MAG: hypothetical protein ABIA83_01325 [Patescibacteria group bacterium]